MAKTGFAFRREELQEAFIMHSSSDNTIPPSKLGVVIRSVGLAPTETQLNTLQSDFQAKNVRALNVQQVEAIISRFGFAPETPEELIEAFRIFDKDGQGMISASEIRHILCNLGEKLTDEEVDEMIREADLTGDGQINFKDFVHILEQGL